MKRKTVQGEFNGRSIQVYLASGHTSAVKYINSIPDEFQAGVKSTLNTVRNITNRAKQ